MSSFYRDFLALLASRAAGQILTILVGLLLVRLLDPPAFAAYSLATTTVGLAGVLADFGLDPILTREIAARPERADPLLRRATALRIALSGLITGVVVGLAALTPAIGRPDLLLIGGLSLTPRGVLRAIAAAFTGLDRARAGAWIEGITAFIASILTVVFVLSNRIFLIGDGSAAALLALVGGNLAGMGVALIGWFSLSTASPARRTRDFPGSARQPTPPLHFVASGLGIPGEVLPLARAALPFVIVALAGALFQSLDIYVVSLVFPHNPAALAYYAAPFRVLNALLLVPTAWGVVALPRYVRIVGDEAALRARLRRDLAFGGAMGFALSAGCMLAAEPLTYIALGPEYAPSAPILATLGWMTLPVCLSAPYIALLTATNRQNRIALSVIAAGVLALGLNLAAARAESLLLISLIKVCVMFLLQASYWLSSMTWRRDIRSQWRR